MNISIPAIRFNIPTLSLPKLSMPKLRMPSFGKFSKKDEALYTEACRIEADAHYHKQIAARITRLETQLRQMQSLVYTQEIMHAPK